MSVVGIVVLLALTAAPAFAGFDEEYAPGNDAFERTWNRTDLPVANGVVERTWIWGPGRTEVMTEPYADSPGGMRDVQYFDKSRMEINDPNAPDDGVWYVTNGLLVVEMITGMMQVGDTEFEEHNPANVQIAGDPNNEFAPTYADINDLGLRDMPADAEGEVITRTLTGDNEVGEDDAFAQYNVTAAERVTVPGIDQTVASPFWEFMNSSGPVWEDGQIVDEALFLNAFYATGLPITPAFWSVVPVQGAEQDVLWQCFERRCLTYTPSNNEGFQVEAGNVGQHYWTWRYGDGEPQPEPDFDGDYYAELNALNESGVVGAAMLTLDGDQLTVHIEAYNLTPEQEHAQHIHGFADETEPAGHDMHQVTIATCPTPELDANDDGLVDLAEGLPAYGPPIVLLEPYPTADENGMIDYEQTLTVDPAALGDPTTRVIVLHGAEVDEEYDGSLPVACGSIEEAPTETATFYAELGELNESGVTGMAEISLAGPLMTVSLNTSGNEADALHPQHIHGMADGSPSTCPTPDLDANEDGLVDVGEGVPAYGPVLFNLWPFPTADAEGNVTFEHTYLVNLSAIGDLTQRVVVTHGMTVGEEYDLFLPISCGQIQEGDAPEPPEEMIYQFRFGELNNSGVEGFGVAILTGDQLDVEILASGLTADQVHMQHIHGQDEGFATCPGPDYDADENGIVDISEGVPAYGGVVQALFQDAEAEEYPTANAEGFVEFSQTFTVDPETLGSLSDRVVVLHGLTVEEEYDGTVPVACALIVPADADTYAAPELSGANATPEPNDSEGSGSAWFWHDVESDTIYYMLSVEGVEDITAAHIHSGVAGESGGVVVDLFVGLDEGESVAGFGILSTGRFTAADLKGDLVGMTLADLVALFGTTETESGAYVNVHSISFPPGELRDQVEAIVPM